jgi:hypothetical protein
MIEEKPWEVRNERQVTVTSHAGSGQEMETKIQVEKTKTGGE